MNHTISDLRYRLLEGEVSLTSLRVLASRETVWRNWSLTFFVLGASHAVRLQCGEVTVTELLTCAPPSEPVSALLDAPANLPAVLCGTLQGWDCTVRLTPCPLAQNETLQGCYPPERYLSVAYPVTEEGKTPVTRIGWVFQDDTVSIETLHTYPEEERVVRSLTLFTLSEALPEIARRPFWQEAEAEKLPFPVQEETL